MSQCVSLLSRCSVFTTIITIHWTNNRGLVFSSSITVLRLWVWFFILFKFWVFFIKVRLLSRLRKRPPYQEPLDWPTRKRVGLGSVRGLSYLHDHCDPKIIHCDVKAANILLDEEFEAIVGDFGLVKLMDYKKRKYEDLISNFSFTSVVMVWN
ncbi:hypothetical protein JHK87_001559 [Glycine soja]|nr:hypothetical protein JHK87_001559 [Glycine soja]